MGSSGTGPLATFDSAGSGGVAAGENGGEGEDGGGGRGAVAGGGSGGEAGEVGPGVALVLRNVAGSAGPNAVAGGSVYRVGATEGTRAKSPPSLSAPPTPTMSSTGCVGKNL